MKTNTSAPNPSTPEATRPAPELRIAKVKGRAICPKGHRAPRVQYLADDQVYCCTTCAVTWKAAYEITIPAGMSVEEWARMAMDAPQLLAALITAKDKALLAIPSAIGLTQDELQEIADVCISAIKKAKAGSQ